jgi:hypothetical protein
MDGGDVVYRLWAANRAASIRPQGKFQSAHQNEGVPMADTPFSPDQVRVLARNEKEHHHDKKPCI